MKVRGRLGGILFGLVLLPIGIRAEEAVHGEPPIVWSLVVHGNRRVPDSAIRFHLFVCESARGACARYSAEASDAGFRSRSSLPAARVLGRRGRALPSVRELCVRRLACDIR